MSLLIVGCSTDNIPPEVTIISPSNGSTVSDTVTINIMSTDKSGIEKVELWVDGISTNQSDNTEPYSIDWNTNVFKNTSKHNVSVRSFDNKGNSKDSNPLSLNVDNTPIMFVKTFGGKNIDKGNSIHQTYDGGYILTGFTGSTGNGSEDLWLIKTNSNGEEEWSKTFGGSDSDRGTDVQQTTNGGFIITGSTGQIFEQELWLLKTNSQGGEEWSKTFGGVWDIGQSVQQTTDGGFIITGRNVPIFDGKTKKIDLWLIKTNSNGEEVWSKTFGGGREEWDEGVSVKQTKDGGFVITGRTSSFGNGSEDLWLIKTNSDGEEEWSKTFGGSDRDEGWDVQQTMDGGFVIIGGTKSIGSGDFDVWIIKTNSLGVEEWSKTFGDSKWDWGTSIQQTTDGGFIVTGMTKSLGNGKGDVWIIKTDPYGDKEWSKSFGGVHQDQGNDVQQTSDGGYIITGFTESFGSGKYDVWLIKTDSEGNSVPENEWK